MVPSRTFCATKPAMFTGSFALEKMIVKLLYTPDEGKVLGAQIVGGDGVDKRIDHLANAVRVGRMFTKPGTVPSASSSLGALTSMQTAFSGPAQVKRRSPSKPPEFRSTRPLPSLPAMRDTIPGAAR